ncbi:hypothetical protein [uncultured Paraglaciecola sp.]|uniref:hypothetical protein n=1 Tax=uncultured Paraglaciecola sp. TaxID=1765024 RepID=UPI00261BF9FE|nr:hypothetical protein [uncultured Paraglaciecola sp.]
MSAPIKKENLKTIRSTVHVHFMGIKCGEFMKRPHNVTITLPVVMFDASDVSLIQFTLLVLTGGKMYRSVDHLCIDENAFTLQ